ncbi:hypothetical protein GW17_00016229 [Ensete ventricosum]|nr:hypothetical protein GW17_00016229 [Ensete ventricosum]
MAFAAATTTTTAPSSAAASPLQSLARGTLRLSFGSLLLHPQSSSASPNWSSPKAVYSANSWAPERSQRKGIWSIRTFGDCGKKKTTCGLLAKALRGDFFSRVSFSGRRRFFSLRREKELSDAALFYFDIVMYVNSPGGSVTAGNISSALYL